MSTWHLNIWHSNIRLSRIQWTGFAGFFRLGFFRPGFFRQWLDRATLGYRRHFRLGLLGLAVVGVAAIGIGLGGWVLLSSLDGDAAENEPVELMTATTPEAAAPADTAGPAQYSSRPPVEPAPVDGLKISAQHWRRAGLGSNALVTFTLRNGNGYAVKDIEISCAFSRSDGSHLTDRRRVIHDTVRTRGRKTFSGIHVGFVNINADRATCAPVAASHI